MEVITIKKKLTRYFAIFMALVCVCTLFSFEAFAASTSITAPKIKAAVTISAAIKISWSKVESATDYYVYRSESKNDTMTYLGKTSKTYFMDKTAKQNKLYYYTAKAVTLKDGKEVATSVNSNTVSKAIVKLKTTSITATSANATSIKLSYPKVENADMYYIYMKTTMNGRYELIAKTSKLTYTVTKLEQYTMYYFKVKATRTVSGKVYSGKYSDVVSANTKLPAGSAFVDFERISNGKELPSGSAITCLTMLMNHYLENDIDKMEMYKYFPISTEYTEIAKDGYKTKSYEDYFLGDPTKKENVFINGCNIALLEKVAKKYIEQNKLEGLNFESYYRYPGSDSLNYLIDNGNIIAVNMYSLVSGKKVIIRSFYDNGDVHYYFIDESNRYAIFYGYTKDSLLIYDPKTNTNQIIKRREFNGTQDFVKYTIFELNQ